MLGLAAELTLPPRAALAFLPFALPVCLWVAWSDMARMKIPNRAVAALAIVFALVGPFVLPLPDWARAWAVGGLVLAAGFVLNLAGGLGAGDAKFAAAAALMIAPADAATAGLLFALVLPAAFATHRIARATPALRRRAPAWESWTAAKFPLGLALGPMLVLYLVLAALQVS